MKLNTKLKIKKIHVNKIVAHCRIIARFDSLNRFAIIFYCNATKYFLLSVRGFSFAEIH